MSKDRTYNQWRTKVGKAIFRHTMNRRECNEEEAYIYIRDFCKTKATDPEMVELIYATDRPRLLRLIAAMAATNPDWITEI